MLVRLVLLVSLRFRVTVGVIGSRNVHIDTIKKLLYNNTTMKRNQSIEDYLECILLLSRESDYVHRVDVARKVGVSQPAVQKAIKILQGAGFVECDGLHIYLTRKGESYAGEIYDRHVTIRDFLVVHGVNAADADADACEMEHVISEAAYKMMKKYVSENK